MDSQIVSPFPTCELNYSKRLLNAKKLQLRNSELQLLNKLCVAQLSKSNCLLSNLNLLSNSRCFSAELHWLVTCFTAACAECNCNDNSGNYDSALHSLLSYAVPGLAEPNQHKFKNSSRSPTPRREFDCRHHLEYFTCPLQCNKSAALSTVFRPI